MSNFHKYPTIESVILNDSFWTPYIENLRLITVPHCLKNFEATGYVQNFISVAEKDGKAHVGPHFTDGLFYETLTGIANLIAIKYDEELVRKLDHYVDIIASAQAEDGYICTVVMQDYPHRKWGQGDGGDIVYQHDLYNQGALIEAAVAYYRATKKTKLLSVAVRCANNICSYIGEPPKHNVIPGHSMPEMAFIMLYRLFRDTRELDSFAFEHNVDIKQYLDIVRFWYDNRGNHENRQLCAHFGREYNQDTAPFASVRAAMGHAVRAGLCYQGAAAARIELDREDYEPALLAIWRDIISKKMHISGGIGARHDIEGFDSEYQLPNNAYLETCAGIALAFFAAEMNLVSRKSEYFDIFELSLYNNILGALDSNFIRFYYDNPLFNDGTKNRWEWHGCPCCPPMLLKCFTWLKTYVYSYNDEEICVNMYLDASVSQKDFTITQQNKTLNITTQSPKNVLLRMPAYAQNFSVTLNGAPYDIKPKDGYAKLSLCAGEWSVDVSFDERLCEICANPNVEDDRDMVCVMLGAKLYCAEGIDNGGCVDFTLAKDAKLSLHEKKITAKTHKGSTVTLIPYWERNNRVSDNAIDSKMAVWFKKENMSSLDEIAKLTGDNLYGYYSVY